MKSEAEKLGENLRRIRTEKGLTQEDIARSLGVSREYVSRYGTAIIGGVILICTIVFFVYSKSPSYLRSLQEEEIRYRDFNYENYTHTLIWYMRLSGCTCHEVHTILTDPISLRVQQEYEKLAKDKPCTLFGYYLYGPGLWLGIIAIFLFVLNFFDIRVRKNAILTNGFVTSNEERQKKYLKVYGLTVLFITILVGGLFVSFINSAMSWGESSSANLLLKNTATATIILCPVIYLAFLWYCWGHHRFNFKKAVFLTVLFPLPLILYLLSD